MHENVVIIDNSVIVEYYAVFQVFYENIFTKNISKLKLYKGINEKMVKGDFKEIVYWFYKLMEMMVKFSGFSFLLLLLVKISDVPWY